MSKKIILYNVDGSPPTRAVKIVARMIGLELEIRDIDLIKKEQLSESFQKINPEHIVPTLDDNGFIIWDSHAICAYLVDKYAKDDKLYPKDLQLRAKCNQRLFFEATSIFIRMRDIIFPILFGGSTEFSQYHIDAIMDSLKILETLLATDPFVVGSHITIADICLAITVTCVEIFTTSFTPDQFPKTWAWLNRIRNTIPFFDEMNEGYSPLTRQRLLNQIEENKQKK